MTESFLAFALFTFAGAFAVVTIIETVRESALLRELADRIIGPRS